MGGALCELTGTRTSILVGRRARCKLGSMLFDRQTWDLSVAHKGREREPVIVINRFAADPAALVDEAANATFAKDAGHYPGLRAAASPTLVEAMLAALQPLLQQSFGVASARMLSCFHSLVTRRPEQLAPIQRLPQDRKSVV